ncbi:MAG: hypothetical protein WC805_03280 [Patescibacteria group bacterium]|jgi:hypothetical protein
MVDFKVTATKPKYAVKIGKVLSKSPSASGFSTALVYRPDLAEEQRHGSLYFVIDISSASPLTPDIAYNLIDIIKEEYYRDLSLDPSQSFESALKAANEEFAAIAKEGEKDWIGKTNVTIAVIAGDKLLAVHRGTNEIHLWRAGKMMHLSAEMYTPGEMPRPEETLSNIIEGDLLVGDKIIISTAELLYYFSIDKVKRIIESFGPAEGARKLAAQLEKEGDISKTNVIIAEFSVPEMATDEEEAPEDNWVGNTESDYGRKFVPSAAPTAPISDNLWGKTPQAGFHTQVVREADTSESVGARASEMAQELDITAEMPAYEEPVRPELSTAKFNLPKVDYGRLGDNLTNITNRAKLAAKSPQLKKTSNAVMRYFKYAWLVIVAVVDLVFSSVSYWVNQIKKQKNGNRILLISVGVLAIVLVASTLALASSNTERVSKKTAIASLDSAIQKRDAAKAALIYEDTAQANSLLAEAYALAEAATKHDTTKQDALGVLAEVKGQLDDINKVTRYANPRVTVDFASIASQLETSGSKTPKVNVNNFFAVGEDIYTYDVDYNKVYKYNYTRNEVGIINSLVSNEKKIKLGAPTDSGLVIYTTPPGIYGLELSDNRMSAANLDSGTWNNAIDVIAYTTKLYFLDPDNNQIWKYQKTVDGYTKIASFFEDNSTISLAGATTFAIDGDMYLLINGVVNKYVQGVKVEYSLKNVPEHTGIINTITDIYASWNTNGLYVLDAANSRVIAFDKDGKYRKQYAFSGITNPSKIFVDEKIGSFWVMSGSQVYQLDL